MTMQTLDPFYIDINIATSVEFQARLTDYVDLIEDVANECALSNIYWHTDSHSDPLTSKIEFWKNFNSGNVNLKTPDGGRPENLDRARLVNKNYRDQLENDEQPITDQGGTYDNFEAGGGRASVEKKIVTRKWVPLDDQQDEISGIGKWESEETTISRSVAVTDPLDIQQQELQIDSTYDPSKAGKWMLFCWLDKFRTAHPVVQRDVKAALGDNNLFFRDFSESIGALKNIMNYYDTATLPTFDDAVEAFGEIYSTPSTVNSVANYIVKTEADLTNKMLSRQTNRVFRSNLQGLMDDAYRDTVQIYSPAGPAQGADFAHGGNLVCDANYASAMTQMIGNITQIVQTHTFALWGVLDMLSNRENYMQSQLPKTVLAKVEEFTVAMDLLKHRIKLHHAPDTSATEHTRYGKATAYNTNMKNDEILMSEDAIKRKRAAQENQTRSLGDAFSSPLR